MPPLPEAAGLPAPLPPVCDGTAALPQALRGSVMLLGSFDGLHRGHMALVRAARQVAGGRRLSILQCDPHPRCFFGAPGRFRISAGMAQRQLLAPVVDLIHAPRFDAAFARTPAADFVQRQLCGYLGVSAVVVGRDFRFGHGRAGDVALLRAMGQALGFAVVQVADECDRGQRISSSLIRQELAAGRIARAVRLMGHDWRLPVAAVAAGWQLPPEQLAPPPGLHPLRMFDAAGRLLGRTLAEFHDGMARPRQRVPGVAVIALGAVQDMERKG